MLCTQIIANFGATPFKGDLEAMKSAAVRHLGLQILRTPLPCDRVRHVLLNGLWIRCPCITAV